MKGFRRILVPVDFSPQATRLIEIASDLAAPDGVVRLLHVVEWVPSVVEGTFVGYADAKQVRTLHAESVRKLEDYAKASAAPRVECEVVEGTAAPAILDVAKREGSDLIVMATHGRAGLGHLLLGNVAEKILRRAACPVLVVRS